ncbi:MAG: hypothetical protein ACT4PT_08230 [Methanobacteriota archaeon]
MGLDAVIRDIEATGRAEAESIVADAKARAKTVLDAARREADDVRAAKRTELAHALEAMRRREKAAAELEAGKIRLDAEKRIIASIRDAAVAKVGAFDEAARRRHLAALAGKAGIPGAHYFVVEKDRAIAQALGLSVKGTFQGLGGLIAESADGTVRQDLRYENILEEEWRASLHGVATTLFGTR